jgi:hypothetical protein
MIMHSDVERTAENADVAYLRCCPTYWLNRLMETMETHRTVSLLAEIQSENHLHVKQGY